jgi:PaaX-like protein C-terminal domain
MIGLLIRCSPRVIPPANPLRLGDGRRHLLRQAPGRPRGPPQTDGRPAARRAARRSLDRSGQPRAPRVDDLVVDQSTFFTCQYPDEHHLVQRLWNLPAWADTACHLDAALGQATSLKSGFMWIAEAVRHLRIDPCFPPELLPDDWPGQRLRERYAAFRDRFAQRLRDYSTS